MIDDKLISDVLAIAELEDAKNLQNLLIKSAFKEWWMEKESILGEREIENIEYHFEECFIAGINTALGRKAE